MTLSKLRLIRRQKNKNIFRTIAALFITCSCIFFSGPLYSQSETLLEIKKRGHIICGVNDGLKGFATANSLGDYTGFNSDFCRAVASAVFNDPTAVEFMPLTSTEKFTPLKARRIDLLSRNVTWTLARSAEFGEFVGINYYDGQGFMVSKRSGFRSALELDNQSVCVLRDTTSELNAKDFFVLNKLRYRPVFFDNNSDLNKAYEDGRCTVMTVDVSGLASRRAALGRPEAHLILPEIISKEPLGPMVPFGDPAWSNIVRWSLNCMINAEEMGIDSSNVSTFTTNPSPAAARLLGSEGDIGVKLGIDNKWCANIIAHIGNYAESFERNVGEGTSLGLARGVNRLWTDGGLIYAPPIK